MSRIRQLKSASVPAVIEATFDERRVERDGGVWAVSSTEDPTLTIVGPMLDPRPGARVRLTGCTEVQHPTFGKQVKYRSYEWLGFADRRGIVRFLADSCDGIGLRTAERIVEAFGDQAIDALRDRPADVSAAVRGLPPDVASAASDTLVILMRESKALSILRGAGLGPRLAQRVVAAYTPEQLVELLASNPWRLADDIDGVGFKTADQLALSLGHPMNSPLRARSGLCHFVAESAAMDGHVLLPASVVWQRAAACGIPETAFNLAVSEPLDKTHVARIQMDDGATDPFGETAPPNLALASLHAAERLIADRMLSLAHASTPAIDWDQAAVDTYVGAQRDQNGAPVSLDPSQQAAIDGVRERRIVVVTGGPGTGKSFLLQAIYAAIGHENRVHVMAPTGKAAVRLRSDSGIPASTIHLALLRDATCDHDWDDDEDRARCLAAGRGHKRLNADVICVDEASMIDSEVMAWLLSSLHPDCSVILFGDVDQLPPVGPGCPFRDVIESGQVPVHRLDVVHRTDRLWLKQNARLINSGEMPRWGAGVEDFFFMERANDGEATAAADAIVDLVARRLPARYGASATFDPLDEIQVLSPMRERGACGINTLNDRLRDAINPATREPGPFGFRTGDKVIQTKNDYDLGVMNGEIGRVTEMGRKGDPFPPKLHIDTTAEADWVVCDFGHSEPTLYLGDQACNLMLAYAITVHRCVSPDTLIETSSGLIRIRDVDKTGVVASPDGTREYTNVMRNPSSLALCIKTKHGYEMTITPDHGVDAWNGWSYSRKEARELHVGDLLRLRLGCVIDSPKACVLPNAPLPGDVREKRYKTPALLTEDVAEFLGLMMADGTIFDCGFRLLKRHADVVNRFQSLCNSEFGTHGRRMRGDGADGVEVDSTFLVRWLCSIDGVSPHMKAVPKCILSSPMRVQAKFLRGLFEDGTVNVRGDLLSHVEWTTCSEQMSKTVQIMLLRFGIISSRRGRMSNGYPIWHIYVYGQNAKRFASSIGFVSRWKNSRLSLKVGREQRYGIPITKEEVNQVYKANRDDKSFLWIKQNARWTGRLSRATAKRVLSSKKCDALHVIADRMRFHHDAVASVEPCESESMCLTVPDGHRFLQNGFSGWNSQGSQWPFVVIPVVQNHAWMMSRKLLYTAVTRAQRMAILVGESDAIKAAIRNVKDDARDTLVKRWLQNGLMGFEPTNILPVTDM